jgi:lipoprotein-anchoring transpeptidase ErfK/SrfK
MRIIAAMRRAVLVLLAASVLAVAVPSTAFAGLSQGSKGPAVLALQKRLIKLKYLAIAARNGVYGPRTTQAVMAFQGWRGLTRDGAAGPATFAALAKASVPRPWSLAVRHMEVHKGKQVLLLIANGAVVRAIHVSTASPGHVTPSGHFTIYRKELMSWSVPFKVWLPLASYFTGGYAFHQYPDVPGYPASHGCVRIAVGDASIVYGWATLGTRVAVG